MISLEATKRFSELTDKCLAAPLSELAECSDAALAQAQQELEEKEELLRKVAKLTDTVNRKVAAETGGTFPSLSAIFERNCDDFRKFVQSSCELWLFHQGAAWDSEAAENFARIEHIAARIDRIDETVATYRELLPTDVSRTF